MQIAVKLGNRSQLIIPKKIRDKFGLGPGTQVLIETVGNTILLKPRPKNYTQHMCGLGKEVWEDIEPTEYVKGEREAWESNE